MNSISSRRTFFARSLGLAASVAAAQAFDGKVARTGGTHLKLALNAYSFNQALLDGKMTLEQVIEFCARHGIDALDATGYYFPGYPAVPPDEYIYNLKRTAYLNGVGISFTAVKNDFTLPDAAARRKEIQHVKDWVVVASKLGAPMMRVFSGPDLPKGYTFDQVFPWMIDALRESTEFGHQHGVVLGIQNHEDAVRTAHEVIRIVKAVDSPWFGSILDVGSLRKHDPYEEIEKLLPYAVSWLIKENVWYGEKPVATDLRRVRAIIDRGGYRGYLPLMTLGEGDPVLKITAFLAQVRAAFAV